MREFRFPVPPVCTDAWSDADWDTWKARYGQWVETEPATFTALGETWIKTGKTTAKGEALYRRANP